MGNKVRGIRAEGRRWEEGTKHEMYTVVKLGVLDFIVRNVRLHCRREDLVTHSQSDVLQHKDNRKYFSSASQTRMVYTVAVFTGNRVSPHTRSEPSNLVAVLGIVLYRCVLIHHDLMSRARGTRSHARR
jgi:hypothetical protein